MSDRFTEYKLWEKILHCVMDKDARIRYKKKEEVFLQRHPYNAETNKIVIIKSPDTHFCEPDIPGNKKQSNNEYRRKKRFPVLDKMHSFSFETEKKRNAETQKIK